MLEVIANVLGAVLGTVILLPLYIWDGIVLAILWNWFIPMTFHGVPALGFITAIGIGLIVGVLTYRAPTKDAESDLLRLMGQGFLYSIMALLAGFFFHFFV